ncbi:unnamed protein product [Rhodiola kirilowii]
MVPISKLQCPLIILIQWGKNELSYTSWEDCQLKVKRMRSNNAALCFPHLPQLS